MKFSKKMTLLVANTVSSDAYPNGATASNTFSLVVSSPVTVSESSARVNGSNTNDTLDASAKPGRYRLNDLEGDDLINGSNKRDILKGGGGNDSLFGSDGVDKLFGQAGMICSMGVTVGIISTGVRGQTALCSQRLSLIRIRLWK